MPGWAELDFKWLVTESELDLSEKAAFGGCVCDFI